MNGLEVGEWHDGRPATTKSIGLNNLASVTGQDTPGLWGLLLLYAVDTNRCEESLAHDVDPRLGLEPTLAQTLAEKPPFLILLDHRN